MPLLRPPVEAHPPRAPAPTRRVSASTHVGKAGPGLRCLLTRRRCLAVRCLSRSGSQVRRCLSHGTMPGHLGRVRESWGLSLLSSLSLAAQSSQPSPLDGESEPIQVGGGRRDRDEPPDAPDPLVSRSMASVSLI